MFALTIRDFLWLVLIGWISLSWQLDAQVKEIEVSDGWDAAALFRADNAILERENSRHRARIQQLEAQMQEAEGGA